MNKVVYPAVLVVEGASDKALIESFLVTEIVTTNGSDVPCETIEYLRELSKTRNIVVLTDPDSPGKRIRDVLNSQIDGLLHAYIPKDKAIKGKKVGVAESDRETILEALSHLCPSAPQDVGSELTYDDLYELGLVGHEDSATKREVVGKILHIGFGNGKTMLKRLRSLGVSKAELRKVCGK